MRVCRIRNGNTCNKVIVSKLYIVAHSLIFFERCSFGTTIYGNRSKLRYLVCVPVANCNLDTTNAAFSISIATFIFVSFVFLEYLGTLSVHVSAVETNETPKGTKTSRVKRKRKTIC